MSLFSLSPVETSTKLKDYGWGDEADADFIQSMNQYRTSSDLCQMGANSAEVRDYGKLTDTTVRLNQDMKNVLLHLPTSFLNSENDFKIATMAKVFKQIGFLADEIRRVFQKDAAVTTSLCSNLEHFFITSLEPMMKVAKGLADNLRSGLNSEGKPKPWAAAQP